MGPIFYGLGLMEFKEEGAGVENEASSGNTPQHATPEQRSLMPRVGGKSCICIITMDFLGSSLRSYLFERDKTRYA